MVSGTSTSGDGGRVNSKEDALLFKDIPVPSWKGLGHVKTLVREVLGWLVVNTFNKLG